MVTLASLDVLPGLTEPGFPAQWKRVTDLGIPVLAVRDHPRFDFSMPDCVQQSAVDAARCSVPRSDLYSAEPPYEKVPGVPAGVTFLDTADSICTATVLHGQQPPHPVLRHHHGRPDRGPGRHGSRAIAFRSRRSRRSTSTTNSMPVSCRCTSGAKTWSSR